RTRTVPVLPFFFSQLTPDGLIGDLPAILASGSPQVPAVMQAYRQYMLQMAAVAQQHGAEALVVGSESNASNAPGSLLWSQNTQWKSLFATLRGTFTGMVWLGAAYGGCEEPSDLDIWTLADGIDAVGFGNLKGSGSHCGFLEPDSNTPTAEQMTVHMRRQLGN